MQHSLINQQANYIPLGNRFRGFCPVVVDLETGGFNADTDALLEVAAVILGIDDQGHLHCKESFSVHVQPFEGANLEPASLEVNGIDPFHPLRIAQPEAVALRGLFKEVRRVCKENLCKRAILVGHNAHFDLNFLHTSARRAEVKNNPFHPFSCFDTVTLGAMAHGQTVLSRVAELAGLEWQNDQAHSALYDASMTAEVFCKVLNTWNQEVNPFIPKCNPNALTADQTEDETSKTFDDN